MIRRPPRSTRTDTLFPYSTALAHGSAVKAMAMIVAGILFGLVGTDVDSGAFRFNLGMIELSDGLSTVAVALGIFGIVEVLTNLELGRASCRERVCQHV